jgi:hypothetical protein
MLILLIRSWQRKKERCPARVVVVSDHRRHIHGDRDNYFSPNVKVIDALQRTSGAVG